MDDLVSELESITVANGYRNDVGTVSRVIIDPSQANKPLEVFVVSGDETFPPIDTIQTVFEQKVAIAVGAIVKSQTGRHSDKLKLDVDAISHDLEKCYSGFCKKYQNTAANRWIVVKEPSPRMSRTIPPSANVGWAILGFTVSIFAVEATF
jgi:hypothetical protein